MKGKCKKNDFLIGIHMLMLVALFDQQSIPKALRAYGCNMYTVHKDLKIKKIVLSNLKEKQKQMCDEDSLKKVEKALNEAINLGEYS